MAENLGAKFTIDITQLKAGLQQANRMIRESESEFRAAAAGIGDWTKKQEGLEKKIKSLNDIADLQKKKVNALKAEYNRLISEGLDPASAKATDLRTQINKETEALNKTKSELDKQTEALEKMKAASESAESGTEKLTDKVKRQEDELQKLKDRYTDVVTAQGKNSEEAKELAGKISDLSGELKTNKDKLKEASDAADDLDQSFENTSNGGISKFDIALGNVIANVVTNAISKLGELASNALEVGSSFEKSMSNVQALSGASGKELEKLEKVAKEYGATTQFSATEAADALGYMALAGWDANQSAAALGGVLNLAAASNMDLAAASDLVTDYMSAFGIEAKDSAKFADTLAYAQANSNTTVQALGEAFKNSAANMKAAGQDVETTTALLAMMANQGLKGSNAGTALTAVMRDMTAKMKKGSIEIGKTSVKVMDANGNYRDMTDILKDVEKATKGMGDAEKATALQSTFTSDSIKGLNLILNAGVDEAAKFEDQLRNSDGSAQNMAKTMQDNLSGDVTALKSNFESLQIELFQKFEPALRAVTKAASKLIDAFKWLMDKLEPFTPVIMAVVGALGALAIKLAIASLIKGVTTAFAALNAVMLANPITLIIGAIAGLVAGIVYLWKNVEGFKEFWITAWETIKEIASSVWEAITSFFSAAWDKIKAIWGVVTSFFVGIWNGIKAAFSAVGSWFSSIFAGAWNGIKNAFSSVGSFFSAVWEGIKAPFKSVADWFKNIFSKAWQAVKDVFSTGGKIFDGIKDGIVTAFKAVVNAIIRGINKVVGLPFNAINGVLKKLKNISILGLHPFKWVKTFGVPQIPELAKGGVVRRATNAIIGEDGAEAVMPLEKNTGWMDVLAEKIAAKSGGGVTVNQTNNYSQAHSRYEIFKSQQMTAKAVKLALAR